MQKDEFLGGEIGVMHQAKDKEFSYLETQVKEQKAVKQGGLFTKSYRTVMGDCRKYVERRLQAFLILWSLKIIQTMY